jgi:hypothetical protein
MALFLLPKKRSSFAPRIIFARPEFSLERIRNERTSPITDANARASDRSDKLLT